MTPHSHLLVRVHGTYLSDAHIQPWLQALPLDLALTQVFHAQGQELTYLRLYPSHNAAGQAGIDSALWLAQGAVEARLLPAQSVELAWLQATLFHPGASCDVAQPAPWHYVVETDVTPSAEEDFNQWYDTEHLPGLAAVDGVKLAQRFTSAQHHPRYHASYDLLTEQTFGCPAWLQVRATPWSDRVRPEFRNTRRIMFQHVANYPAAAT